MIVILDLKVLLTNKDNSMNRKGVLGTSKQNNTRKQHNKVKKVYNFIGLIC